MDIADLKFGFLQREPHEELLEPASLFGFVPRLSADTSEDFAGCRLPAHVQAQLFVLFQHSSSCSWTRLTMRQEAEVYCTGGIDAPICQDIPLGGTRDGLARAEVCHDTVVDLAGEEAFETPDDLASGPTVRGPSRDVVEGRLVVPHADDNGAIEGRIGLSVPASIEAVPAGGDLWVANYYSARNPLRLSSLVILGVVARMFRCATRSSCWCT